MPFAYRGANAVPFGRLPVTCISILGVSYHKTKNNEIIGCPYHRAATSIPTTTRADSSSGRPRRARTTSMEQLNVPSTKGHRPWKKPKDKPYVSTMRTTWFECISGNDRRLTSRFSFLFRSFSAVHRVSGASQASSRHGNSG